MKKLIILLIGLTMFCVVVSGQKLIEPKILGTWIYGEDPSEFLLHRIMETSQRYLNDNPNGKLIVRICSSDDFSSAFVKTSLSPFAASRYNQYRLIVPYEKIFIANSSKCSEKHGFVFNEYWFVPDDNTLDYDQLFPVNSISLKSFSIDREYDYDKDSFKKRDSKIDDELFLQNIAKFADELKRNEKAEGLIVHNSKGKKLQRNMEKVKLFLEKEKINPKRIKIVNAPELTIDKNAKLKLLRDDKDSFPQLKIIAIDK